MIKFESGEILRFTYNMDPMGRDEDSGDRFKEVLVLHPNWQGKVHAIDLKRLTVAEREVLDTVFDKEAVAKAKLGKPASRLPLVNDILRRMDPLQEVKNPVSFYSRFVKVFLRNKDAYRTYYPFRMINVTVVKKTDVRGKPINPKPMFGERNVFTPKETEKPAQAQKPAGAKPNRLDLIRQRAQQKKPQ